MATFKDTDIANAFSAVADLHPDAQKAMKYLLRQGEERAFGGMNVLGALIGDEKVCAALTEREGKMLHPDGALVIDCTDLDAKDLLFPVVEVNTPKGVGIATVKGPLLEAWDSGRPVVLQNYSRMRPGTDSVMHAALQFFSGEVVSAKFHDPLGSAAPVTLTPDDRKESFRLRITSSAPEFEDNVSNSAAARLNPYVLHAENAHSQYAGEKLAQSMTGGTTRDIDAMHTLEIKKPC